MEGNFWFLSLDGLDDRQVRLLQAVLHPSNYSSEIEFPWSSDDANENEYPKTTSLNVHAPAFEAFTSVQQPLVPGVVVPQQVIPSPTAPYTNGSYIQNVPLSNQPPFYQGASVPVRTIPSSYTNGQMNIDNVFDPRMMYSQPPKPFNGEFYTATHITHTPVKVSSFNLNPLSKPFMPSNIENIVQPDTNGGQNQGEGVYRANLVVKEGYVQKQREVRDVNEGYVQKQREVGDEGYVQKREVRDVNEGYVQKREVRHVNEGYDQNWEVRHAIEGFIDGKDFDVCYDVREGYVVKDMKEGYIRNEEVSNVRENPEIYSGKSYENRVVKSREDSVKVNSNLMKVNEKNVMERNTVNVQVRNTVNVQERNEVDVKECNEVKVQERNIVHVQERNEVNVKERNEVNVQERNTVNVKERNEVNVQGRNEVKSVENKVMKVSESSLPKFSDSGLQKVSENKLSKVNDVAKVSDVHKSNNSEAARDKDVIVRDKNSAIEKYAEEVSWNGVKQGLELEKADPAPVIKDIEMLEIQPSVKPARRSWADIVSKGQKPNEKTSVLKPLGENEKSSKATSGDQETVEESVAEDTMALALGKHLFNLQLNFQPVPLQARGLINRRNWCYINATLQALLACPPFYTLLRNLPLGPGVERGKSSTPVIDSMVKVAYEFLQYDKTQEDLQAGQPFQPDFIYDMLRDLKSDCLKGQQEDAEEFLSFILNGMHEEMVKIIKNYEKKNHLDLESETKENGGISDGEEEWQVIGSKHKGMVTRKVAEHKTPISDLLGGQIKSFLTTSGSKTSASIQPFFTLQLDVQSENVTSVSEALKEMTIKEPIQGYTCAKTKQEVEAFSHIALQKLPPILILHLKRFVYNKNGGCKKVMKKTDYPITLEINRDMFSPDVKKSQRLRQYKLFAVMYHDGEEAVKGHYISDVYNHGSQTWIRCDDRTITTVTEEQVLSYSPPRVPYLLFYHQES